MTTTKQTAAARHAELKAEALTMLAEITAALNAQPTDRLIHWGHVGDLSEVVKNLRSVGHWAGVKRLVER